MVGASKADQVRRTTTRTRSRAVSWLPAPECRWQTGQWSAWVSSTATAVLQTLTRPPDQTDDEETRSGGPYWTVSGGTACEYQAWMIQPQRNRAVFSAADEEWQHLEANWEDDGSPTSTTERTGRICQTDEGPDSVPVSTAEYRDGPCTLVGPPPMFIYHRQRRTVTNHYHRPHVWSNSQERWVDGTRESTPYNTVYGVWSNIGSPLACPLRSADGGGGDLTAGKYILSWDNVQIELTVPAEASVSLYWRERDAGPSAAVLSVAGEGDLVVEPDSPLRSTRQPSPEGSEGNVLTQIAASLRVIEEVVDEP